ncbi:substrate-binding domain-containing protein [Flavobacterium sp. Sd200]|uniref:LacI family DNA-binding transcriptional regulator n=1 Tax=Flavobacterium sp. Sd200 TaxID=2692211 RepID=UPI00136B87D1|nr:LacI family DNA-binding transcriptional regulator [Flavobacterium sp. Sd200]MXN90118.1 substrate-binding domain-containing protein [Flavobacterium sp. Sd200]
MANITIKDIAKALGLSVSTVSKSLNDISEISPLTKQRVIDFANTNNYRANKVATSLKNGKTNTVGVIVCSINNTFISQVLDGIQKASLQTGYDIVIMQSFENTDTEKSCLETLISRGVDGILIAPVDASANISFISSIIKNCCPVIIFDRISCELETVKIGVDEYMGALKATQHLIKKDRKRIVFITAEQFGENHPRFRGFQEALKKNDIQYDPDFKISCNLEDIESLDEKIGHWIKKLRSSGGKPDAIFGATDIITTRTLGILAKLKIKVPNEIAVIGFSNTDIAFALNPPLSTIRQPATDIGFLALTNLAEVIKTKAVPKQKTLLLHTKIQFRASSKV